jgi:hypothetical protein
VPFLIGQAKNDALVLINVLKTIFNIQWFDLDWNASQTSPVMLEIIMKLEALVGLGNLIN